MRTVSCAAASQVKLSGRGWDKKSRVFNFADFRATASQISFVDRGYHLLAIDTNSTNVI
jgi:hypothetical protein